jgi:hypothetical protein
MYPINPAPTLKAKVAKSTDAEKALAKLMTERAAYAKKNKGNYPSDEQLMKSRKKK